MSTKIWSAARVPVGRYHEFLTWVVEHTAPRQMEIYKSVVDGLKDAKAEDGKPLDDFTRPRKAAEILKTIHDNNNRLFGPQTPCLWAQVYLDSKWAYLIFIGQTWEMTNDAGDVPDGALPEYAQEYHYQNQIDPPKWADDNVDGVFDYDDRSTWGPGYTAWHERGETWNGLFDAKSTGPLTTVAIWGWDTEEGGRRAAWEMERRLHQDSGRGA